MTIGSRTPDANKNGPFTVRIWDVKTFKQSREPVLLFLHKFNRIGSLTFSPDGKLLLMTQGTGGDILQILDLDYRQDHAVPNELIAISRPGGDPRYLHDGVRKAPHRSLFFSADTQNVLDGPLPMGHGQRTAPGRRGRSIAEP